MLNDLEHASCGRRAHQPELVRVGGANRLQCVCMTVRIRTNRFRTNGRVPQTQPTPCGRMRGRGGMCQHVCSRGGVLLLPALTRWQHCVDACSFQTLQFAKQCVFAQLVANRFPTIRTIAPKNAPSCVGGPTVPSKTPVAPARSNTPRKTRNTSNASRSVAISVSPWRNKSETSRCPRQCETSFGIRACSGCGVVWFPKNDVTFKSFWLWIPRAVGWKHRLHLKMMRRRCSR